jgi:hypothetical protein
MRFSCSFYSSEELLINSSFDCQHRHVSAPSYFPLTSEDQAVHQSCDAYLPCLDISIFSVSVKLPKVRQPAHISRIHFCLSSSLQRVSCSVVSHFHFFVRRLLEADSQGRTPDGSNEGRPYFQPTVLLGKQAHGCLISMCCRFWKCTSTLRFVHKWR